jgi:hypothetical protein
MWIVQLFQATKKLQRFKDQLVFVQLELGNLRMSIITVISESRNKKVSESRNAKNLETSEEKKISESWKEISEGDKSLNLRRRKISKSWKDKNLGILEG